MRKWKGKARNRSAIDTCPVVAGKQGNLFVLFLPSMSKLLFAVSRIQIVLSLH